MKSEKLSAFEKVSLNLDILDHLFGFLDIGDIFRFANVTQHLQFVAVNFILSAKEFKKIKLKKYCDTVRLKSDSNKDDYSLTYEEYEYFLNIFGPQITSLNESHSNALNVPLKLKNLTSIKYNFLLITKQQIQLIADTCPLLEDFFINGCCNKKHELVRLIIDIEVGALMAMTRLKSFSLKTGLNYKIKYGFSEKLTKKIKLPLHSCSRLEKFDICMSTLATKFLSLFPQLQKLAITVFFPISSEEMNGMATACPQLKELSFVLTSFEGVEKFSLLQNLKVLSFYNCDGLTYENLMDILTRTRLETFTSIGTKYEGVLFHYYFLTPTMKSVYVDAIKSFDFKTEKEFYRAQKEQVLSTASFKEMAVEEEHFL